MRNKEEKKYKLAAKERKKVKHGVGGKGHGKQGVQATPLSPRKKLLSMAKVKEQEQPKHSEENSKTLPPHLKNFDLKTP